MQFRALGVLSGTSAEGISTAIIDVSYPTLHRKPILKLIASSTVPFTRKEQKIILALSGASAETLCEANFWLGERFAHAVAQAIRQAKLSPQSIDLIGSHGQTVCHRPRAKMPSTLQLGEPSVLAERTGITTVADFRPRDIAAGGEGAPLMPYLDYVLWGGTNRAVALQNIGGIANVSVVGKNRDHVLAFDTGPGNMLIDEAVRRYTKGKMLLYDKDGTLARKGSVNKTLLSRLNHHPFLKRRPPKSCGREEFGADYFDRVCAPFFRKRPLDVIATLTYFTASSIAQAYGDFVLAKYPVREIIVSGGGVFNSTLMVYLQEQFTPIPVKSIAEYGIDPQAKEPMLFALLACEALLGRAGNVPSATGAKSDVVLGEIVPGRNYSALMRRLGKIF